VGLASEGSHTSTGSASDEGASGSAPEDYERRSKNRPQSAA
jgi:hypothetical protein